MKCRSIPQSLDNLSAMLSAWIAHAAEPNSVSEHQFCEETFAVSPHVAQAGSCLAHMPYVALVLLGLTGFPLLGSPSLLPAIDARERVGGKADEVNDARIARRLLWIQVALQTFTGLAGHALPNPAAIATQEISILLAFGMLALLLLYTSEWGVADKTDKGNWIPLLLPAIAVGVYLSFGLLPVIFITGLVCVGVSLLVKSAFDRFTDRAKLALGMIFAMTLAVLGAETLGCEFLQNSVAGAVPWHMAFDIMFWQVLLGYLDLCLIAPPGELLKRRVTAA